MREWDDWLKILNEYLDERHSNIDRDSEAYLHYLESAKYILGHSNFIAFPTKLETNKSKDDTKDKRIFHIDVIVNDMSYWKWILKYKIRIDYEYLKSFETLKFFLEKQVPLVTINAYSKEDREKFRNCFRVWLLAWYEAIFWLQIDNYVDYIGFEPDDKRHFTFTNGVLDLSTQEFTPWTNIVSKNPALKLNYPLDDIDNFTWQESLRDMYALKKYISPVNSTSSIIVWQLIGWIFRDEYKTKNNEFPFLWIQSITGAGKTSLLNLISWICWYDNESVEWTWNTSFASLNWMSYTWQRYYFYDEFQQLTNGQLKTIQSAYNSSKRYKGWMWKDWWELGEFNTDCNLVCAGENISPDNQALIDRFTMIDSKVPFLIVKNVKDPEEFRKYESLTGEKVNIEYLDTDMIRLLAQKYYRPRFMNILKHKLEIPFLEYFDRANEYIKKVVQEIDENIRPATRIQNNLVLSIMWYLMVCWENVDEDEVHDIIKDYFDRLMAFHREAYVSWKIVNHIINNINDYCSWIWKVKWAEKGFPMIYLKYTEREKWLIMQIPNISKFTVNKLGLSTDSTTAEQQLKDLLWIQDCYTKPNKVGKWLLNNMRWIFIPHWFVERNESLKKIRDSTLDYLWSHMGDLKKIRDDDKIVVTNPDALQWLIREICETYSGADFYDTNTFTKEEFPEDPF